MNRIDKLMKEAIIHQFPSPNSNQASNSAVTKTFRKGLNQEARNYIHSLLQNGMTVYFCRELLSGGMVIISGKGLSLNGAVTAVRQADSKLRDTPESEVILIRTTGQIDGLIPR